jgi:hypothetical protein
LNGTLFFVAFFLIFATATYLMATPMFPSDIILKWVNASALPQTTFFSALINGIAYGLIAWAVFAVAMRRIGSESRDSSQS